MGKTLFISQNPLNRCENLAAVWEAYDGPKEFRCGQENMVEAEAEGFSVVVCDALPKRINGKDKCKLVNIDHGLTGGKLYGLDEGDKPWVDPVAFAQIDYAIASSRAGVPIVARTFGISTQRVLPLGAPRTDKYFNDTPPDDEDRYKYLYAPTFRRGDGDGRLPDINWGLLDLLLEGNEGKLVEMLREAADNGMGPTEERCRLMTGGKCDGHSTERVCDLIRRLA